MRKIASLSLMVAAAVCLTLGVNAAEKEKAKGKLVCPVSGKEASKDHAVAHNGGKVYFCCDNCPKEFEKNTEKYSAKANSQLVASHQFRQAKCPLTGRKLNPAAVVAVNGVKVRFCCDNCKGKVAKAEGAEQLTMCFSDEAFKKGFIAGGPKARKEKKDN